jgi:hypothetical protein
VRGTDICTHRCMYALKPVEIGVNDVPFLETFKYTVICVPAGTDWVTLV